jgi:hypothetical protein
LWEGEGETEEAGVGTLFGKNMIENQKFCQFSQLQLSTLLEGRCDTHHQNQQTI